MARFFIKNNQIQDGMVYIKGPDVHHIVKSLRMKPGDKLSVVDEAGVEYEAIVHQATPQVVECNLAEKKVLDREPPVEVVLCQGLPKGDKLELIIQKSVELGAVRLIPVHCQRTIVQLTGDKAAKRLQRWQRVAEEAAKQSRRNRVPEVSPLISFREALELIPENALALMPWEEEKAMGLKRSLMSYNKDCHGQIWLFIGPEGGFSEKEAEMALKMGVRSVTLGPRILRTETAGIAALAMTLFQLGDLGGLE